VDQTKPFFLYYCPGANHAPHQVPEDWADKYRGQFDAGWTPTASGSTSASSSWASCRRNRAFAASRLGQSLDSLSADEKRLYAARWKYSLHS